MVRFAHRWAYAAAAAILLGGAGLAQAAETGKVKCEVMHSGKKEVKQVASAKACTKMGGKVVTTAK